MDEILDQFLEQLLTDKGLTALEGEERKEVKEDLAQRILDQINISILNALSEEKAIELDKKLDDENFGQNEVIQFVAESGVDTQNIILAVMAQFRAFYLAGGISTEREISRAMDEAKASAEHASAGVMEA